MSTSDLTRRAVASTAALSTLLGYRACAASGPRRPLVKSAVAPQISMPASVDVAAGRRFAVVPVTLVSPTSRLPITAPAHVWAPYLLHTGVSGQDYVDRFWGRSMVLHWQPGDAPTKEIVVELGPKALTAAVSYVATAVYLTLGPSLVKTNIAVVQPAKASLQPIWSMPMDQASLDAIRPTTTPASKLPRSTFGGYDVEATETGVDVYNDQVAGLSPFVVGSDERVHLRCVLLPSPIKTSQGKMASIGQARLIAPTSFQPGDLVEWDVQHVNPGWLITWTTGEFGWPATGEIDIEWRPDFVKNVAGGINLVQHYPGAPAAGDGGIVPVPDVDFTKPHIRSIEWSADGKTVTVRINGVARASWPMNWNGKPQIIVTQATAYLPCKAGIVMPELSLGSWVHYKPAAT